MNDAKKPLLIFLAEVAGGRKLLEAVRDRRDSVSYVAVAAPKNQPAAGQLVLEPEQVEEAARSRVSVTLAVLQEFGIDAVGEVLDPDPLLAVGDAIRAHRPGEVLLSCLYGTRSGLMRRDLLEGTRREFEPETTITHIPVRIEDDSIAWDVNHTLVVATQTVASPDLLTRLIDRAGERPHRYTIICPGAETLDPEKINLDLATTLASLYRAEIDATGQPINSDPYAAVLNALRHYRIDDILISTFAGEQSRWLGEDLIGRVRELTDKPVEHTEVGRPAEKIAAAVAEGPEA